MTSLTVLHNPNPELRKISEELSLDDIASSETQQCIDALMETMIDENGVGIAAPQVGVHKRIIIVESPSGAQAYVNPTIVTRSLRTVKSMEGCLSVPGVSGVVKRYSSVKVQAKNRRGEDVTIKANGLTAIIFQHEIDHLDGVLFIDKATDITKDVRSRL